MPDYRNYPVLAAYIDRIGAEQRNFRRFVVIREDRHHYHFDAGIITLCADGQIKCNKEEFAPTEEERAAIAAAIASANWPASIGTRNTDALRQKLNSADELFEFSNAAGDEIIFVQQRKFGADGKKSDLPWSFWSDGEWRCMEPDNLLPLFGLDRLANAAEVFIHEGAKTAKRVWAMVDGSAPQQPCPWQADLKRAAHIGWPGGAPNAHRVDWEPIRQLPPHVSVTIVCDNDMGGEEAAPEISRRLQRRCGAIRFGKAFPPHFDLADEFPVEMFKVKKGRQVYDGPNMRSCCRPATWVTRARQGGKGFDLREQFIEEWQSIIKPAVFIHREQPDIHYDEAEFNALCAPFSDVPNVAQLLRRSLWAQAEGLVYEPGQKSGRIAFDGRQVFNCYLPSPIKPIAGNVTPWLNFMEHLIPNKDECDEVLKWCATLIARPDIRMTYGLLLVSQTQGVGKSTLGEKILAPLVGMFNCSFPDAGEISNSDFNSWMVFKRLSVIAEIYAGHSSKVYNKLKAVLTDQFVAVNEKYEKSYFTRNHIHLFATSNSMRALKFDTADRRWYIPRVTEEKRDLSYWTELNAWLVDGGLSTIAHWAQDYNHYIETGRHAPNSERKQEAVIAAMSDGERFIAELGEQLKELDGEVVLRLDEVRMWLAGKKSADPRYGNDGTRYLEMPETISYVLRGCGLYLPAKQFEGEGARFRVVANFDVPTSATWGGLKPLWRKAAAVYGEWETAI